MTGTPKINTQISSLGITTSKVVVGLGCNLSIPCPEEFFVITEKQLRKETDTFNSQCF